MNICEICKCRYSKDCSDGGEPYSEKGCKFFSLDWESLLFEEQSAVIDALKALEDGEIYFG